MVIREIARLLEAEVLVGADKLDQEVDMAFSSDMMSDVLAYVTGSTVLLTGLVNEHVIRTAEMVDLECIVFVRGKEPDAAMIQTAAAKEIVLMTTDYPMFPACGILYAGGLRGGKAGDLHG